MEIESYFYQNFDSFLGIVVDLYFHPIFICINPVWVLNSELLEKTYSNGHFG